MTTTSFLPVRGGKHSELNIGEEDLHVIYVWILPDHLLMPPSYLRSRFDRKIGANRITSLVGKEKDALPIGQNFKVSRLLSDADREHVWQASSGNGLYAFVFEGEADIAGHRLRRRDSIGLESEERVKITARTADTDLLLVETAL